MIRKAIALLIVASPLFAQAPFEGTVVMNLTPDNGRASTITFMLKDGKMRFDPSAGPNGAMVTVILDPNAQRVTLIMNQQKMYMDRDFPSVAAIQQQTGGKNPVVKTGKTDIVAGYKCEHLTMADDDGTAVDACVSHDLGGFRLPSVSNPMSPQREAGWITQLGTGAFPLKVVKNSKTIEEVTAITKKPLDPELFLPPQDFTSFQMPRKP